MEKQLDNLYKSMTPKELANIAFSCISGRDETALNRVLENVPRRTYSLPDAEYLHKLERISTTAMYWGMMFWKLTAAFGLSNIPELNNPTEKENDGYIRKLTASVIAMKRLCETYGLSFKAVCRYTGIGIDMDFLNRYRPDETIIQNLYDDLEKIMTADRMQ